ERTTDRIRFTFFHRDVGEYAIGRRRHLQRYFVGFELDQWLVHHHRIPLLLEPFANRRFGHRFAQGGYADVSHGLLPQFCTVILRASEPSLEGLRFLCSASRTGDRRLPSKDDGFSHPSASSRNCLSCARCFDICPTAVEAEAGRPA